MPGNDFKGKLIREFAEAAKHYAWAVDELNRQRAVLPREHYEEMHKVVEAAHKECERLRSELSTFKALE